MSIMLDGKEVDLTKPLTWGNSIVLKDGGSITQTKDNVTTIVTQTQITALNAKVGI